MIAEYQAEYCNDPECEIPHSDLPLERAPGLPPYRCGDLVRHKEVAKPGPNKADPEPDGKLPHQHGADCLPAGKVLPPDMDQGNEDCENGQEKRHDVCYGLHAEKYKVKGRTGVIPHVASLVRNRLLSHENRICRTGMT